MKNKGKDHFFSDMFQNQGSSNALFNISVSLAQPTQKDKLWSDYQVKKKNGNTGPL